MYGNSATTTTTNPHRTRSPIDVLVQALRLDEDGSLGVGPPGMAGGDDDWQLASFHVETDADVHADHWEIHPASDEAVWCLHGALRVLFRGTGSGTDAGTDPGATAVRLRTGEAVIVPSGTWHRLELDAPSDVASIVRRRGTQLERVSTPRRREDR
jgi:hypothetical protein